MLLEVGRPAGVAAAPRPDDRYLLERELRNQLGSRRPVATLLTMIEVDAD